MLKWSSASNTRHRIHGGCLVAYAHSTAPQLTALQHSGSSGRDGTCTLGTAQATRVGMATLWFKTVKLEGPVPPPHTRESWSTQPAQPAGEGGAASLVQLTEALTNTAQTLHVETDSAPLT